MPKGTPKKDEYQRTTAKMDRMLNNDIKFGKGVQDGYKDAVQKAPNVGAKVLNAVGGAPYWLGAGLAKATSTKIANYRSRNRNK